MPLAVSPDYFAAYAKLPVRARHAADALVRRLVADPCDASIQREILSGVHSFQVVRLPVARDFAALAWAPEGGDAVLVWVGPAERATRQTLPLLATLGAAGGHPANGAVPVRDLPALPTAAAPQGRNAPATAPPADVPLNAVQLPTRMYNFADRKGITTLRALAAIAPYDLHGERNLGRTSIAQTRIVIEETFGMRWEELAALPLPGGAAPALRRTRRWDAMRTALSPEVGAIAIDGLAVTARVRSYAAAEGMRTVADLASRSEAELLASPNFGRGSVQSLVAAVFARTSPPRRLPPGINLVTSWRAVLDQLDPVDRTIAVRRSGLDGPKETGEAIAKTLGHPHSYAFQRESKAIDRLSRQTTWVEGIHARAGAALGEGGAIALDVLAGDPWWAAAVARPEALAYLCEKILRGAFHVVRVEERAYLARATQEAIDEAWESVRRTVEAASFPRLLAGLEARAMREAGPLGGALSAVLWERARGLLVVHGDGSDRPRAVGLRARREEAAIALLRASAEPMRLRDLVARVGPLSPVPAEILHIGPDLVGVPKHFPRFSEWKRRLVPIAIGVMGRRAPGRRWSHLDLFEAVRGEAELPEWLDAWHLGALLRHSGRLREAGFGFLALPDGPAEAKKPPSLHDDVLAIVREHGAPIPVGVLRVQLAERTSFPPAMLSIHLGQPPFVWCDADHIGLVDRDLPGGEKARAQAVEHVVATLERRGRGLAVGELHADIAPLSRVHARWTRQMCLTALKGDLRFRFSTAGGVGLVVWESPRVPSRGDLLRQCLDAGGGRAKVSAIARKIAAHYGETPSDERVGAMAYNLDALKHGDWIERRNPARK